jgi:hypothetical protein
VEDLATGSSLINPMSILSSLLMTLTSIRLLHEDSGTGIERSDKWEMIIGLVYWTEFLNVMCGCKIPCKPLAMVMAMITATANTRKNTGMGTAR